MAKFVIKKVFKHIKPKRVIKTTNKTESTSLNDVREEVTLQDVTVKTKISDNKKVNDMDTKEKITYANAILSTQEDLKVKKVKKEKGLIERTESSKIILTEDNKELLND